MLLHSIVASLLALLAGVPVALAFFDSTLIQTQRGKEDLDISTLQGQRVVKLVQYTSPSITTTWAFFNLFSPLEMTEDFPEDSEDCIGHEGCIVRTLTLHDSKPMTIHVIPLDSEEPHWKTRFSINLKNSFWLDRGNYFHIQFVCDSSMIESMKPDISPIEPYWINDIDESDTNVLIANISSNFLGVRRVGTLGTAVLLDFVSNITCNVDEDEFFGNKIYSLKWFLIVVIGILLLIFLMFSVLIFCAGSIYGKRRKRRSDIHIVDSVERITGFSHANNESASNISRRAVNTGPA
ncbi:uncharacterized protein V1516DRAFT_666194 [Lipomyces oligophaga]|uniref:uncharacterized protein n=1 Tax=Lipomyces oligophaga TaxID=45792 RepID=UPI0034CD76CF